MVPGEAGSSAGGSSAGGAGQQIKGAHILAAETFAHHAPLPGYLDHIPCRLALATSTRCCSPSLLLYPHWSLCAAAPLPPTTVNATLASHFSSPRGSHFFHPLSSMSLLPVPLMSLIPVPLMSLLPFPPPKRCEWLYQTHCSLSPSQFLSSSDQCPTVTAKLLKSLCFPSSPPSPLPPLSMWGHDGDDRNPCIFLFLFLPYSLACSMWAHDGDDLVTAPGAVRPAQPNPTSAPSLPLTPSLLPPSSLSSVLAHDGDDPLAVPWAVDLHNDIYNMTFYNGCAYNVTSPLRVWQCFEFNNVWEGILANPAPNPTHYRTGDIFVQTTPGYCEMQMNHSASGTLQMLSGETVNIVYAWTVNIVYAWTVNIVYAWTVNIVYAWTVNIVYAWTVKIVYAWSVNIVYAWTGYFRPCVQNLRFGNDNSYSMTNTTECTTAAVIWTSLIG
ncbi:unnamed protein product [Closterium sp. NIES-53]